MPYAPSDVRKHNQAAAASGKSATWTKIANNALRSCKASGKGDCDAYSIRVANAMVKRMKESSDFLMEAGRVLSAKNEGRLQAAIKEINDILAMVAPGTDLDDLTQEALAPELVAYFEANPDVVVEVSDLLGEPLQLDEADEEVPTKDEVNFREATEADMDAGHQCSTCSYFDNGQCGLLEAAVDGDDACDSWTDEAYEEATTEIAGLIANGTIDPAELQALDEGEEDLEEHNTVPHGGGHGGRGGAKGGGIGHAKRQGQINAEKAAYGKGEDRGMAIRALGGKQKSFVDTGKNGTSERAWAVSSVLRDIPNGTKLTIRSSGGASGTGQLNGGRGNWYLGKGARNKIDPSQVQAILLESEDEMLGDQLIEAALPMRLDELLEGLRKDGTFPVKIISPGWGTSGYYAPAVLEKAANAGRFPAGLRMFWDHPTKSEANERPERSLRDLAAVTTSRGEYRDTGPDGPGVYAEAKAFELFRPYIEELAPHIGVSMRGYGGTKTGEAEGKKGALVEDIIAVQSADFVTQAGRGGKILQLFEAARTGEPFTPGDLEESDMPELVELQETLAASNVTISRLQEQLAYRDARDLARELVGASGLPQVTQKRLVEAVLADVPIIEDERTLDQDKFKEGVDKAIKEEREYLQALGGPVVKDLGESTPPTLEEAGADLESALAGIMGSADKAKLAVVGREN